MLLLNEPEADLRLAMWNADGSRGAVCGTALRCTTAILAKERGGAAHLRLASDAGFHATRVDHHSHGIFRTAVDLGRPSFDAAAIPFDSDRAPGASGGATSPFRVRLPIGTARSEGMVLSMGNPHLIVPVDVDPADLDLDTLGPPLESADYFPDRANVSFARVVNSDSIVQRTVRSERVPSAERAERQQRRNHRLLRMACAVQPHGAERPGDPSKDQHRQQQLPLAGPQGGEHRQSIPNICHRPP